MYAMPEVLNY
uniref:Uncharacterized protein n=1 Tax=Arundo donax TaxID=35708 RepID=A0A0A9C958_ARUDO